MAEDKGADIPDLKKAAAQRGFAWSADGVLPKAAPVPPAKAAAELFAKFKSSPAAKAVAFVVMMSAGFALGLGVFGATFLEVGPPKPGAKGGLAGLTSRLRVRSDARNRLRYIVSKGEVFFTPFKSAAEKAEDGVPGAEEAGMPAIPEVPDVSVNVNVPEGAGGGTASSGSRAMVAASGGTSASASAGAAGAAAKAFGGAAKFDAATGKLNAKSLKKGRVTRTTLATGGDRKGNARTLGRTVTGAAATMRPAGAAPAHHAPSGLDFVRGDAAAGGGSGAAAAPGAPAAGGADAGAGGGAGAGAGDGAGPGEGDAAGNPQDLLTTINTLMEKASKKRDEQADNEKKAAVLAALGQHPQALYHYDKAKKAEKKAKQYEKEAQQLTVEAAALSGAQTTPAPQPAP